MVKWIIIIGLAGIAVVAAVVAVTEYVTSIGKDRIVLTDGEEIRRHVSEYYGGHFAVVTEHGMGIRRIPVDDIRRITFATRPTSSADQVEFMSGRRVECRVLSYSQGRLVLQLPSGERRAGGIGHVERIRFHRP